MPPVFEAVEHALDDVAGLVKRGVVFEPNLAVFARRDAGCRADAGQPLAQVVRVIPAICDDGGTLTDMTFKALTRLGNLSPIARGDVQTDRLARPIADQVQLRVQPAFRPPDCPSVAGVFLIPPAAIRWALIWLASIIRVERSARSAARASNIRPNTPASDQRL